MLHHPLRHGTDSNQAAGDALDGTAMMGYRPGITLSWRIPSGVIAESGAIPRREIPRSKAASG
jgi:hypothetical protein